MLIVNESIQAKQGGPEIERAADRLRANEESIRLAALDTLSSLIGNFIKVHRELPEIYSAFVGTIKSDDKKISGYSFNTILDNGKYKYGFVLAVLEKGGNYNVKVYTDNGEIPQTKEKYNSLNWYGALYYKVISVKYKGKTHYLLLGLQQPYLGVSTKVIEPLIVAEKDFILGDNIFSVPYQNYRRILFQHGSKSTMVLNFEKRNGRIVFDHLSPSSPEYEGVYQAYGPDFTYDAFEFKKGKWEFKEMVEARNN